MRQSGKLANLAKLRTLKTPLSDGHFHNEEKNLQLHVSERFMRDAKNKKINRGVNIFLEWIYGTFMAFAKKLQKFWYFSRQIPPKKRIGRKNSAENNKLIL